jgi:PAS domain S-box-containing protein
LNSDIKYIKELVREQFKGLFQYSLDLIYVYNLQGDFIDANDIALEKMGYSREEIQNLNLIDILDNKGLKRAYKSIRTLLKTGEQIETFDYKVKKKDTGYLYVDAYGIPVKKDKEICAVLGIAKDITERKLLNKKLKLLVSSKEKALRSKEIYYNNIFEYANDLIAILDADFKHEYVNKHYEEILGYTSEELIGQHPALYVYPEDYGKARKTTLRGINGEEARTELRYVSKNGDVSWFELKGKFFETFDGEKKSLIISRDIRERKEAEKMLKKSEEKYRTLFQNIPDGFAFHKILYDEKNNPIDYKVLEINSAFENITGLNKKSILGNKIRELWSGVENEPTDWINRYDDVATTRKPARFETYSKPIQKWYDVLAYSPMKNCLVTILTDITQKKEAEEKLKESQEIFQSIANQSFIAMTILQDDKLKFWNREFLKQTGYSNEEVGKWKPGEYLKTIHPKNREFVREQADKKQMGIKGYLENYEFLGLKKTGESYWCEIYSKPVKYNGRTADLILTLDIDERKTRQKELKKSEEKYRLLVEKSPYSIILFSKEGIVLDCNPATYEITHYDEDDLVGKKFFQLDIFPNQSQLKELVRKFKQLSEGLTQKPMNFEIKRKDGKKIWVKTTSIVFQRNNQTYIQTILNNITEQKKREELQKEFNKKLEEKVDKRTKKLEEALAEQQLYMKEIMKASQFKSQFMATMSHEFRTPLNVIIGFSELLLEREVNELSSLQEEYLNDILSSAEHLLNMIKEILDISKIDSGVMELKLKNFSLEKVINQTISEFRALLKKKSLEINIQGLKKSQQMYADPIKLKSILYNIISNAIKFSNDGIISIEIEESKDEWLFRIEDEGIGISEEERDIIFKEFKRSRSEKVRNTTGTGLGLPLTKRLINLHGGEIWFESILGDGTIFSFTIPKHIKEKKREKIENFLRHI